MAVLKYDLFLRQLGKGSYCKAQTEDAVYSIGQYCILKYTPSGVLEIYDFDDSRKDWNCREFNKRVNIIDKVEFMKIVTAYDYRHIQEPI